MKKLSIMAVLTLLSYGSEWTLQKVLIKESKSQIAQELQSDEVHFTRQQDLAQILQELHPEINMVRASAIGNDIVLRGFKRDDINVLIDGAKIYGGCPNRMDPPAMHISTADIKKVQLLEGPYDVEYFGSMGGQVKVITKDPKEGFGGRLETIIGSFGYKKIDTSIHAGNEQFAFSIGIMHENSEQYKDGAGKTLVEQNWDVLGKNDPYAYQKRYANMDAYNRNVVRAKAIYKPFENQKLRLSFMSDKATNILYPAFQMDAQLDKTFFVNADYSIADLGRFSKELLLRSYYANVKHDMGTKFRNAANNPMLYRTHKVQSIIKGATLKNSFVYGGVLWSVGIDTSKRTWNGTCVSEPSKRPRQVRIPDVDTLNKAIFAKGVKREGPWQIKVGVRYDQTDIKAHRLKDPTIATIGAIQNYYKGKESRSYDDLSANVVVTYDLDKAQKFYVAAGEGVRVPDAQELYFIGFMSGNWTRRGNPNLKESKNRQIDLGYSGDFGFANVKATLFYSDLKNYIYAYRTNAGNANPSKYYLTWTNIDAHIYGGDIGIIIPIGDFWMMEGSFAYQRGKKDERIAGQNDRDLAMIPPARGRLALSYDDGEFFGMVEFLASAKYKNIDSDNGEQPLKAWRVLNLKASKSVYNNVTLNFGVDNLFDQNYALNNTYAGRALIGGRTPVLINEPGRFAYINAQISF